MAGVNKVILLGNLGSDPEVRHLESGSTVANLSLATSESYKDKEGNRIETTEWHRIEMWEGLARVAEQYLRQGDTIYVEGKIKSRTWQDEQGNNRKDFRIRAINMNIVKRMNPDQPIRPLSATPNNGANNTAGQQRPVAANEPQADPLVKSGSDNDVDDLPF